MLPAASPKRKDFFPLMGKGIISPWVAFLAQPLALPPTCVARRTAMSLLRLQNLASSLSHTICVQAGGGGAGRCARGRRCGGAGRRHSRERRSREGGHLGAGAAALLDGAFGASTLGCCPAGHGVLAVCHAPGCAHWGLAAAAPSLPCRAAGGTPPPRTLSAPPPPCPMSRTVPKGNVRVQCACSARRALPWCARAPGSRARTHAPASRAQSRAPGCRGPGTGTARAPSGRG